MTLCNNSDQTWFSDALTSARPLRGHQNPRLLGSGFNTALGVQQMLMHRKSCLISILEFHYKQVYSSLTQIPIFRNIQGVNTVILYKQGSYRQVCVKCKDF